MASKRRSIYVPDHLRDVLDLREDQGQEHGLSQRVATILERYRWITSDCPKFARNEWMLILDACNGWASWAEAGETLMVGVALEVHDACRLNQTHAKWDLTEAQAADLVQRLDELTRAEKAAVIERIERFWRRCELDTDEALQQAGIVPAEES